MEDEVNQELDRITSDTANGVKAKKRKMEEEEVLHNVRWSDCNA